jgi:hypothetical protein
MVNPPETNVVQKAGTKGEIGMRKMMIGLALTAVAAVGVTSIAQGESKIVLSKVTGTPKAGTKKAPVAFSGGFDFGVDSAGLRGASQFSYEWWWEGVQGGLKGFPTCTAAQIDAGQTDSVCPKGSQVGSITGLVAQLGPEGDGGVNFIDCKGKSVRFYNSSPTTITWFVVGPGDQCAGVGYLAPFTMELRKVGKETHFFTELPLNIRNPLPGIEGALTTLPTLFFNKSAKIKGKKQFYFRSTGCKGTRDFTFRLVDKEGTKTTTTPAGKCKPAPKPKKKK